MTIALIFGRRRRSGLSGNWRRVWSSKRRTDLDSGGGLSINCLLCWFRLFKSCLLCFVYAVDVVCSGVVVGCSAVVKVCSAVVWSCSAALIGCSVE